MSIAHRQEYNIENWNIDKSNRLWMSSCLCSVFPPLLTSLECLIEGAERITEDHFGPFVQDTAVLSAPGVRGVMVTRGHRWLPSNPRLGSGDVIPRKVGLFSWRISALSPRDSSWSLKWVYPDSGLGCTELVSPLARARDHQHSGEEREMKIFQTRRIIRNINNSSISPPGPPLHIFVTHFSSKLSPRAWRLLCSCMDKWFKSMRTQEPIMPGLMPPEVTCDDDTGASDHWQCFSRASPAIFCPRRVINVPFPASICLVTRQTASDMKPGANLYLSEG